LKKSVFRKMRIMDRVQSLKRDRTDGEIERPASQAFWQTTLLQGKGEGLQKDVRDQDELNNPPPTCRTQRLGGTGNREDPSESSRLFISSLVRPMRCQKQEQEKHKKTSPFTELATTGFLGREGNAIKNWKRGGT